MSWPVLTGDRLDGGGHTNTAGFTKQEGLQYHISGDQSEFDIKSHKGVAAQHSGDETYSKPLLLGLAGEGAAARRR